MIGHKFGEFSATRFSKTLFAPRKKKKTININISTTSGGCPFGVRSAPPPYGSLRVPTGGGCCSHSNATCPPYGRVNSQAMLLFFVVAFYDHSNLQDSSPFTIYLERFILPISYFFFVMKYARV